MVVDVSNHTIGESGAAVTVAPSETIAISLRRFQVSGDWIRPSGSLVSHTIALAGCDSDGNARFR